MGTMEWGLTVRVGWGGAGESNGETGGTAVTGQQ